MKLGVRASSYKVPSGGGPTDPFTIAPWVAAFWAEDPAITTPPADGALMPTTWNQPGTYTVVEWTRVASPTFQTNWRNGHPALVIPTASGSIAHRLTTTFAA